MCYGVTTPFAQSSTCITDMEKLKANLLPQNIKTEELDKYSLAIVILSDSFKYKNNFVE